MVFMEKIPNMSISKALKVTNKSNPQAHKPRERRMMGATVFKALS